MKKFMKQNRLLGYIILVCLAMHIYGTELKAYGYDIAGTDGTTMPISLAFLQVRNGVFPWNMEPQLYNMEKEESESPGEIAKTEHVYEEPEEEETIKDKEKEEETVTTEETPLQPQEELPLFTAVEESYFDDALFIGDSRMVGVYEYAGLENATFYAKVSMTIYNLMDSRVTTNDEVRTVRQGLENNQFGKIYLMVGLNELGTGNTEYFVSAYQEVLQEIQTMQPHALIYIQGIMHVSGDRDSHDSIFNNENIDERNAALKELANGRNIVYIDVNSVYDDENGNLNAEYTADDVHLLGNCYEPWYEFYLQNAVVTEGGN